MSYFGYLFDNLFVCVFFFLNVTEKYYVKFKFCISVSNFYQYKWSIVKKKESAYFPYSILFVCYVPWTHGVSITWKFLPPISYMPLWFLGKLSSIARPEHSSSFEPPKAPPIKWVKNYCQLLKAFTDFSPWIQNNDSFLILQKNDW